jgi:hypothetical protein
MDTSIRRPVREAASPSQSSRVAHAATLDSFVLEPGCAEGVSFASLETGSVVRVQTRYSTYQMLVLDAARRHVLVKGGSPFPELTEARVVGATTGGSMVKTGWIGVGLRLELSVASHRILTSRVESISVDHDPIA